MIPLLFSLADKYKFHVLTSILLFLCGNSVKSQSTSSGNAIPGWGVTATGNTLKADSSVIMTVSRATDSITSLKASVALKTTLALALAGISLTTTGSGVSTYNNSTGVFNIPNTTFSTNAKADNSTKGIATFDSTYFNDDGSGLISYGVNYGTGSVSAGAVTVNHPRGKITYTSPSITAGTAIAVTFTNSFINATSTINIGLNGNGSNLTLVNAYVKSQTAGSCVINIQNLSLLSLFNSTFIIDYFIVN